MEENNQNFNSEFWKKRAEKFNELEWVNDKKYLEAFIKAGDFQKNDIVLDVGTGTGIIARAVSPFVREVVGLDKSQDMIEHGDWGGSRRFVKENILNLNPIFEDGAFDKVTARHVFHHILSDTQKAMDECYRLLKNGGKMILSEGVPPHKKAREDYIEIFKLKEKRLTFLGEDLEELMRKSGFKNIEITNVILEGMSIKNWMRKSGLLQQIQDKIFDLHINSSDFFKRAYNLKTTKDDCLVNFKMAIVVGKK